MNRRERELPAETMAQKTARFLNEFSKAFLVLAVCYAFINMIMYWVSILCGKTPDSQIVIDSGKDVITGFVAYCTLQLGRNMSANKNGVYIENGILKRMEKKQPAEGSDGKRG